ncbi:MAG TPA: lantibiotic dehydratase [Pyrinomonadaceae bacterium]|jgi:hypothetical protein|nr:lantibiotic dehydratase [Pyrinomonadaceae bacterium]
MSTQYAEELTGGAGQYGASAAEGEAASPHRVGLPGGRWDLWRWAALRGAGFPAAPLLDLAEPECGAAAREVVEAGEAVERARREAVAFLKRELEGAETEEARGAIQKVLRALWKGKLARPAGPLGEAPPLAALGSAHARAESLRAAFAQEFEAAMERASQTVYDVACSEEFREAVIWQNRHAFHNNIAAFLREKPGDVPRNSARRKQEELIATYLQRYCVKNDTIGFFGPVGWARLDSEGPAISTRPGPTLLGKRNVYSERWCIDTLTEMLSEDEELRPWIAPRRLPFYHVEGTTLYSPVRGPVELPEAEARVLLSCDGVRTAREVAAAVLAEPPLRGLASEREVFDLLARLCDEGLIVWKLECPVGPLAEQHLRGLIERVGDDALREEIFAILDEIRDARLQVARAAGDAGGLDCAIKNLEETFSDLTGEGPTRAPGEIYAGRTLVYEDCERDLEASIGPDVLRALGPPLSLLLDSARWFTHEVAGRYRDIFTRAHAALARQTGSPVVEATALWGEVQPHLVTKELPAINSVLEEFQRRWSEVLAVPAGVRRVSYTADELRGRVGAAFDVPGAGWRLGRYQSPDVMIAASGPEAIRRGDYQLVMGELHLGINTLGNSVFVYQHPSPDDLFTAYERDLPEPCVVPIPPRQWPTLTARTALALVPPKDYRLALSHDACSAMPDRTLAIGEFVVEESGGELCARTRDGRLRFEIVELFGALFSVLAASYFKVLPPGRHTPRVTVDRLVVSRESWRFPAEELHFAHHKAEAERFVDLQRWARAHGVPRFVFVKAPIEPKPFYVDFESPILVNFFTKTVRQTVKEGGAQQAVSVTEMLPAPDQLWLPDAEGRLYTSELRIVAIESEA